MSKQKNYDSLCAGCQQPIWWRYTGAGKLMPLDAQPSPKGTYVIEDSQRCRPLQPMFDAGLPTYTPHWATCPDAERFKAKKGTTR